MYWMHAIEMLLLSDMLLPTCTNNPHYITTIAVSCNWDRFSVEFYEDVTEQSTIWYKGTMISYSRQVGYVVSFDGYGPEKMKQSNH